MFTLIGNDGGLLERAVQLRSFDIAPAERFDLLIDLNGATPGDVITLRSRAFKVPGIFDTIPGVTAQGSALDLVQLRVTDHRGPRAGVPLRLPEKLSTIHGPDPAKAVRERKLELGTTSEPGSRGTHIQHTMDTHLFDMSRVDYRARLGETEIWTFTTDMMFSHPVHFHATHFKVIERTSRDPAGRNGVMPWEAGLKDTVLVQPGETVKLAVQFTAHRGLFLVHCHNLEHEDVGMMSNLLIE